MPDPQQQTTPTSVPAPNGGVDLSGLRVRTLGGIDLSGLRVRTLQQAKAELPQPQIAPPWEGEPSLPSAPTSKLGKAYADVKQWLTDHEQHVSEKYLAPFREGLDRLGEDLQTAGESGHTPRGGQLTGPTRALVSGAGTLLKQVPVGRNVKETALMSLTPPEFPEGKALSRELKAGERAAAKVHEPVGIHEDDVPRRSNVPDVDWSERDLQDSAKAVNEHTIAKDYGPKRKGAKFSVYKSHIPMEDLPSAKIVEEEDPEFQGSDWRENYQGLIRSTTPPIKVRVNPKGEMEILDGNHRAQLWSEADMTHAPAWVVDERGKGIESLSESERAERAEELEQRQQEARQKTPDLSGLRTRPVQKLSATAKEVPTQPRLPDTGTHAAIKTDDGGIYPDLNPEKQRTHIMLAQDLGIPPERVVSGGWLKDGEYEGSERSDAGRWGEQARAKAAVAGKRASRSQTEPQQKPERRAGVGGYSGDSPTESQFVQKVTEGAGDTETWAPADMGDGGKAWLDADGKYIPQDKEHQDIAGNFWNRNIRIGNLERKGPLLVHAEGAPTEAQRKAIAADIKKQGGAIYDLKKDGNNVTGEAKTVGDFLRAIDSTWKPDAAQIDLSGLRVRPVKAGRQAAGMDTFIASDGKKYQYPSSDATWNKILKVDPGAKKLK